MQHDPVIQESILEAFHNYYPENKKPIRLFFAPGRVNLIGEHTDYNGGFVLPTALTLGTYMAVRPRTDSQFRLRSLNFPDDLVVFHLDRIENNPKDGWGNYPKGIIKEIISLNLPLTGADILYKGDIPNGAGLSSSASIGMVTGYGFSQLLNTPVSMKELAHICQRMENHFIGVNTGIMDQTAVGFGKENHAIFLNCLTYDIETIPLNLGDYKIIITNTNKSRGLADSKYNERRAECDQGLKIIQRILPNLTCLGELTFDQYKTVEYSIDNPIIKKRVKHVITENRRVLLATKKLKEDHLLEFGDLMKESHESLRDDYEVTGFELDALFDAQKNATGCIGTRMTGAGFGGCTVSLVHVREIEHFQEEVAQIYKEKTGKFPTFYTCDVGDGVRELNC